MAGTAPRKSSLGARRNLQKAHIPYRGDNPAVGKKTGIAVQHVEPTSDGFEPFEQIMSQADKRTPPKVKTRKRKSVAVVMEEEEEDGYGEMSMELDSPIKTQYMNAPPPVSPTSYYSTGSSARLVSRTLDVDFDRIPSPGRGSGSSRKSLGHRTGPSRLSQASTSVDHDEDNYDPPDSPMQASPQHASFEQMDQDEGGGDDGWEHTQPADEEEPVEEEEQRPPVSNKGKGKERAKLSLVPEEPEAEVEDEIAAGLANIEEEYSDEGEQDAANDDQREPSPPPRKKTKITIQEPKKPRIESLSRSKKENRSIREGVRRSNRTSRKPLEWWRGEKYVYGLPDDDDDDSRGPLYVAPIKEVMRIPQEVPEPLGKRKRGQTRARSKSRTVDHDVKVKVKVVRVSNPEEGWDEETQPHAVVVDYVTRELVERRIAWTAKMIRPEKVTSDDWAFQKVFGDAEFFAAGILVIPPCGRKPSKPTKDNTYVFFVLEGAINLKIHDTNLVLATGAMFIVPRGNTYFIENIATRDAKLFFTQARKVAVEDVDAVVRPTSVRPTSAGAGIPSRPPSPEPEPAEERQVSKAPGSKRTTSKMA